MKARRENAGGVTLVEIMVAMALVVLLLGAVNAVLGVGTRVGRCTGRLDAAAAAGLISLVVHEDLEGVAGEPGTPVFVTTPASVTWVRRNGSGTEKVSYAFVEGTDGRRGVLRRNGRLLAGVALSDFEARCEDEGDRVSLRLRFHFASAEAGGGGAKALPLTVHRVFRRRLVPL